MAKNVTVKLDPRAAERALRFKQRIEEKVEILERCDNSRDIYKEMESAMEQWYWECDTDSLKVSGQPWGAIYQVELCLELLDDLREYTEMVRCDSNIPDRLDYITSFWDKESVDESDDEKEIA